MKERIKNKIKKMKYLFFIEPFLRKNKIKMIKNLYKDKNNKRVLIIYIIKPFLVKKIDYGHSNFQEAKTIANIFREKEYIVDVVDYTCMLNLDYSKYDIIFGFGDIFERSFLDKNFKGKRIFYATGADRIFQNDAEIKRVEEFRRRTGTEKYLPKRLVKNFWNYSHNYSDYLFFIGNNWTKSTFKGINTKYSIPVSNFFKYNLEKNIEDIKKTRSDFLWFGSLGLVHKGLDLCIEAFNKGEKNKLNICGDFEKIFYDYYKNILFENKKIKYKGFLNLSKKEFKEEMLENLFVILPSCSEGMASSVIACTIQGLIPIVTKETGIDYKKMGGFLISDLSVKSICGVLKEIEKVSDVELLERSRKSKKYSLENNTIEAFESKFKENLKNIGIK